MGDLASAEDGAAIDTPVGAACTTDAECGRCARCDATNRCAVEPIVDLFLGHRSTCYAGANGDRWCAGVNEQGQLGLGHQRGHHACGLEAGRWRCFGLNDEGQLGVGTTTTTGQFAELCP